MMYIIQYHARTAYDHLSIVQTCKNTIFLFLKLNYKGVWTYPFHITFLEEKTTIYF